jgi:hypothetical protein
MLTFLAAEQTMLGKSLLAQGRDGAALCFSSSRACLQQLSGIGTATSTIKPQHWSAATPLRRRRPARHHPVHLRRRRVQGEEGALLVDLLVYKRECLKYLTTEWLDSRRAHVVFVAACRLMRKSSTSS